MYPVQIGSLTPGKGKALLQPALKPALLFNFSARLESVLPGDDLSTSAK